MNCDVAVVGGGPAGLAVALEAALRGFSGGVFGRGALVWGPVSGGAVTFMASCEVRRSRAILSLGRLRSFSEFLASSL